MPRSAQASSRRCDRASTSIGRGASATITRRLSRTLAVSGRYGIDRTKLLNIKSNFAAQPEIDRLFPQVRLSSVASSLIRDTRNDPIEPNSGSLIGVDAELAARRIGSEVGFFKTFVQGFTYRQLPRPSSAVIVFGARLGLATGFPRDGDAATDQTIVLDDLPASERFFAGGDTTVRGFTLDRLGTPETIDQDGFPTGGQGLVVLNAEARIPLRGGLGAVGVHRWRQRLADGIGHGFLADARRRRLRPALSFAGGPDSRRPGHQARSPDAADGRARAADGAAHFTWAGVLMMS